MGKVVTDQCIAEGLAQEVRVHLAPVLLGGGTRLFGGAASGPTALQIERVVDTPTATHLTYRVAPPQP